MAGSLAGKESYASELSAQNNTLSTDGSLSNMWTKIGDQEHVLQRHVLFRIAFSCKEGAKTKSKKICVDR